MLFDRKKTILNLSLAGILLAGSAFAAGQRDPFSPLVNRSGFILIPREIDVDGLSLGGIIYSEESPVAIINEEVLKENDEIGGYTVFAISGKKVVLKKDGGEFILKLEDE